MIRTKREDRIFDDRIANLTEISLRITDVSEPGFALVLGVKPACSATVRSEHPMALAIIGGLVTSTVLNLFLLPALFSQFGGSWVGSGTDSLARG